MVRKIFTSTFKAFEPFFDEQVIFIHNKVQKTLLACVFPIDDENPFSEQDVDSDIKKIHVIIRCCKVDSENPVVGDTLKLDDKTLWKVSSVTKNLEYLKIEARSFEC